MANVLLPVLKRLSEQRDVALLLQKYGNVIQTGGHSGTRKRDYSGVEKIELHLPF